MRKRSFSKTEIEDATHKIRLQHMLEAATSELQEQLRDKEDKNREQKAIIDKDKEIMNELTRKLIEKDEKIEKLNILIDENKRYSNKAMGKINQDLSEFIKKVTAKSKTS